MRSPFPGMDPYLEARWSNVHVLMMGAITGELNRILPDGLEARPEEDVRIESIAGERMQGFRGDVAVVDVGDRVAGGGEPRPVTATVVAEPVRISYHRGPVVLRDVRIVDTREHDKIISLIEVLSPWNKLPGQLNRDYSEKLRRYEEAGANWIKIDLLRSSRDRLPVTWKDVPAERRATYLVVTYRALTRDVLAYPISVRQILPVINVPLRKTDEEARLNLQAALDRVYADGAFGSLDYSKPLNPPLDPEDGEWAAEQVAARR